MNERAISTMLGYVLTLAISALLVAGLLTVGGSFVDSQQAVVVDSGLQVIGQRLAGDLATADRLAQLDRGTTELRLTARLPTTVSQTSYTIDITTTNGNTSLILSPQSSKRNVTVDVANTTAISPGTVTGGDLVIVYNDAETRLEVEDG